MQVDPSVAAWPALPTETEIYILPDGRVVIADLPAELASLLSALGAAEPCALLASEDVPITSPAQKALTPSHGNE